MLEPAPAPAPAPAPPKKRGILRTVMIWVLGLGGGAFGTYFTAVFNTIIRPPLPVANFSVSADGLTATCQNHATGENGWWDFGDGSPLEPFQADQPTVTHTYAKAGSFGVKLTVRNLTSDENDRTVAVEVSAAAKDSPPAPKIAGFTVAPASPSTMAPATFRATADVQNAEYCVWDLGDGRTEVTEGGGKIDRLLTFDKPGAFSLQLVAHNGKEAVKQAAAVKIDAPPDGTLTAVLTITDGGARVERLVRAETLAVPAKDKAASFSKAIAARPRCTLIDVAPAGPPVPNVKNVKIAIAADKKSATVTGEWVNQNRTDALIPLSITEEKTHTRPATVAHAAGVLQLAASGKASAVIPLPPLPANLHSPNRKIDVEVRQVSQGKVFVMAAGPLVGRGPVTIPARNVYSPPAAAITTAGYDVDKVTVTFEIGTVTQAGGLRP